MTKQHSARIELRAIMRLAGPLIASQLAHMLMVLTDTLMMARLSPEALAGGSLGAASYSFVSIFCLGVIASVGTLVSIRQGAGEAAIVQLKDYLARFPDSAPGKSLLQQTQEFVGRS